MFYEGDVAREEAQPAIDMLEPMASSALTTPTRYAGWRDYSIPFTYMKCSKDRRISNNVADPYISRLRAAGLQVNVETIDAGHCPALTAQDLVVQALRRAIE